MVGRRGTAVAVVLGVAGWLGACGDKVILLECPLGTRPEGSQCIPLDGPDTAGPPEADAATPADDLGTGTSDIAEDTSANGSEDVQSVSDSESSEDASSTPRPAGAACELNAQCAGGTCLDWPTGYCSAIGCSATSCPDGARCLDVAAGNSACLSTCEADADCRTPHQACKRLPLDDGSLAGVCVGLQPGAAGPAAACDDPARCAGQAACLSAFPGGYCAVLGCSAGTCPDGTDCVLVNGTPSCLKYCARDGDCGSAPGAERACGVLTGISGAPSQVCISGISGKALGAPCLSDFECTSGACQILGEGRCNASGAPCFPDRTSEACGVGDYCRVTASSRVGLCARPCSAGVPCLGASFCLAEGARPSDTWCRPACAGAGSPCPGESGLSCRLGLPLGDGGQGRYACTSGILGGPFVSCNGDATCAGGRCLKPASGAGYCAAPCGDDDHCGFGGTCVRDGTSTSCWRLCTDASDCPTGFRCDRIGGGSRTVCVPR
jgi:hypothetical protein